MPNDARISSRIDPELKRQADAILAKIGMKPSQAITIFYKQIVEQRGLPFDLKVPNDETLEAMREVRDPEFRKKARRYHSADDLINDLDS